MKNLGAIILLFIANSISTIAQGISMIAIPWYFVANEMFPTYTKWFILVNILLIFWVPYSGILIDKYDRRKIFMVVNLISGCIVLGIAALGFQHGGLAWYWIAAVFAITFLNYSIHYPNLYAFVQEITEPRMYNRITSWLEIQGQASSMLAGAAAAILLAGTQKGEVKIFGSEINIPFSIEAWPIEKIFLLDGITYLVSLLIISLISYVSLKRARIESGGIYKRLQSGINYFKKYPEVFVFGIASYCLFVTVILEGFLLGAKYVEAHMMGEADMYALSDMFYAVGALLSGATVVYVFKRMTKPSGIIILTLATAGLFFVLFSTKDVAIFYGMLFVLGLTNAGSRILRTTTLFEIIPNDVFGRAVSIFNIANIIFRICFIGIFTIAFFDRSNNIIYAFLICSIFLVGAAIALMFNKTKVLNTNSSS